MVAGFESDLIEMRAREAVKVARAKGRLRGEQPELSPRREVHLVALHGAAIDDAFARWDRAHLHRFTLTSGRVQHRCG
jgi:hypothetical protein